MPSWVTHPWKFKEDTVSTITATLLEKINWEKNFRDSITHRMDKLDKKMNKQQVALQTELQSETSKLNAAISTAT